MGRKPAFDDLDRGAVKRERRFDTESAQAIIDETHFVVSADVLADKLNRAVGHYCAVCAAVATTPRDSLINKRFGTISKQAAALAESLSRLSWKEKGIIDLPEIVERLQQDAETLACWLPGVMDKRQRDATAIADHLGLEPPVPDIGGRPQDTLAVQELVIDLAGVFEEVTGQQSFTAWVSRDDHRSGGFFLDFVVLCLRVIEPREASEYRREALVKTIQRTVGTK